jgi:hypothetical protein
MDLKQLCDALWSLHYAPGGNNARAIYDGAEILIEAGGRPRVFIPAAGRPGQSFEVTDPARVSRIILALEPSIDAALKARRPAAPPPPSPSPPTDAEEEASVAEWLERQP